MPWQLNERVRAILVCPKCRGELADVERGLLCMDCSLVYPVVEDIPMMLVELAKKAQPNEIPSAS